MGIFSKKLPGVGPDIASDQAVLAETVLNSINDGVIIIDQNGIIKLMNPAAARMTGNSSAADGLGLAYLSVLRLENGEGMEITDSQNPLAVAVLNNEAWESRDYYLVTLQGAKIPVSITMTPSGNRGADRIITFRDIAQELQKEGEQTEFISTASHEMRTPVASIEGYLGLALNPQTATIDDRARQYLNEAHNASQHLGKLFQDLLDVTKLDDNRIKLHLVPTELISAVRQIAEQQIQAINAKNLSYSFGATDDISTETQINQPVYAMVDPDFLQEILNNLIENAIKYTESGGAIWINVRADGDNALINVTDTGMGISPDNLTHIFQKFYRVDNSATRTIGGTGLGLYIVKERVEAMGGRVWAESSFGEGSTFYVTLPRISAEEYERQTQVIRNVQAMTAPAAQTQIGPTPVQAPLGTTPVQTPLGTTPVQTSIQPTPIQTSAAEPVQAPQPVMQSQPTEQSQTTRVAEPALAADMPTDKLAEMKRQFAAQVQSMAQVAPQSAAQVAPQDVAPNTPQDVAPNMPQNLGISTSQDLAQNAPQDDTGKNSVSGIK